MENLQTKSEKQYYIPMEVNETSKEFIIANGFDLSTDAVWTKIGHRTVRAIMIPATKEQYLSETEIWSVRMMQLMQTATLSMPILHLHLVSWMPTVSLFLNALKYTVVFMVVPASTSMPSTPTETRALPAV